MVYVSYDCIEKINDFLLIKCFLVLTDALSFFKNLMDKYFDEKVW